MNALLSTEVMGVLFFVAGVVYAARRRTLIRQQLGIAGVLPVSAAAVLFPSAVSTKLVQPWRSLTRVPPLQQGAS